MNFCEKNDNNNQIRSDQKDFHLFETDFSLLKPLSFLNLNLFLLSINSEPTSQWRTHPQKIYINNESFSHLSFGWNKNKIEAIKRLLMIIDT